MLAEVRQFDVPRIRITCQPPGEAVYGYACTRVLRLRMESTAWVSDRVKA